MALINITFTGNIYNTTGTQFTGTEVKYQLYFYKVNSGSSSSVWSSTHLSEYGQYNINLGDGDILTPSGLSNAGDKIIIAFWTPNTSIRSDDDLLEWGFIEVILDGSEYYIKDVQLKGPMVPVCDFNMGGATVVNADVIATDVASHNIHSWIFGSTTMYQEPSRYSQPLFYVMNTLQPSSSDIDWGDGIVSNNLNPAESYTHQFTAPGSYDITTYVTNVSNLSASQLFMWSVYYSTPVVNFTIDNSNPTPVGISGMGQLVTFTNISTNPDSRAFIDGWTCDWVINDGAHTATYTGQSLTFNPTHQFHSPGSHDITLTLNWYNGFAWVSSDITHQIIQEEWSVANGVTWTTPVYVNVQNTFVPDITGDTSFVSNVNYLIDGYVPFNNLGVTDSFNYTFDISNSHTIQQIIYYNTGFAYSTQEYTYPIIMSPIADFYVTDDVCGDLYTSNSEPGKQPIVLYKWKVYLNNVELSSLEGPFSTVFRYNWPTIGNFKIWHEITDALGQTASTFKMYPVSVCKGGGSQPIDNNQGGMAGGGVLIKEKPLPKVRVKLLKMKDPKIKIEVKLII